MKGCRLGLLLRPQWHGNFPSIKQPFVWKVKRQEQDPE
jgi:hypothetical protein